MVNSQSSTLTKLVEHEISTGQHRGVLEFGVDNHEDARGAKSLYLRALGHR